MLRIPRHSHKNDTLRTRNRVGFGGRRSGARRDVRVSCVETPERRLLLLLSMDIDSTAPHPAVRLSVSFRGADIILRTSDGVDFHLHKSRLRDASPHFRSMFSTTILSAAPETIQSVDIDIPSATLWYLMHRVYADELRPIPTEFSPHTCDDVLTALKAADKFEFDDAEQWIKDTALTRALEKEENPLRAWALATHYKLTEVAKTSALRFMMSTTDYSKQWRTMPELSLVDASTFTKLIHARDRATLNLRAEAVEILWQPSDSCGSCEAIEENLDPEQIEEMKFRSGLSAYWELLSAVHPMSGEAASPALYTLVAMRTSCDGCKRHAAQMEEKAKTKGVGWHIEHLRQSVLRTWTSCYRVIFDGGALIYRFTFCRSPALPVYCLTKTSSPLLEHSHISIDYISPSAGPFAFLACPRSLHFVWRPYPRLSLRAL